jgi:formate dehydrogenase subunit beta
LRPCEIRALIELVKLQQATLEGLTLIGVDCPGTYELPRYMERRGQGSIGLDEVLAAARDGRDPGSEGFVLRTACRTCLHPAPDPAAIRLELFGLDPAQGLTIEMPDDCCDLDTAASVEAPGRTSGKSSPPTPAREELAGFTRII